MPARSARLTDVRTMITARAFAKINLDLRILGVQRRRLPRAPHDLSVARAARRPDVRAGTRAAGRRDGRSGMPRATDNIVERAASALWRAAGRSGSPAGRHGCASTSGFRSQAGLGGGSADAAAALRAIARLWRIRLTSKELQTIAASLGADVPFFLEGGTVRGRGRGDMLSPLADRSAPLGGRRHPAVRRADGRRVSVVRSGMRTRGP